MYTLTFANTSVVYYDIEGFELQSLAPCISFVYNQTELESCVKVKKTTSGNQNLASLPAPFPVSQGLLCGAPTLLALH